MQKSKQNTNENLILIADDDAHVVTGLKALLEAEEYNVLTASDGLESQNILKHHEIGVALVDLIMPKVDGLKLLLGTRKLDKSTQFIIITGKGTIDTAVQAMRAGAYDYLTKPVDPERLKSIIPKALEHYELLVSNRRLRDRINRLTRFENLIGQSSRMKEIFQTVEAVADTPANIMITGESGTGKELVARAVHKKSNRNNGPFVALNCAALPKDILENELFGHEKGAFTGALQEKPGSFELAHKGTLFLDEIGDMPVELQAKILRALEEKQFRRLGGKKEISVDVRIIAATNQDPEKALREDLYFRVSVVEIEMPPLRERISDLPLLMGEFLQQYNKQYQKQVKGLSPQCIERLNRYSWPGNIRELKNVIERAVLLCRSDYIEEGNLPKRLLEMDTNQRDILIPVTSKLDDVEKRMIQEHLRLANYNKTKTAQSLGISLKTLYNKLERYNL